MVATAVMAMPAAAQEYCSWSHDLQLVNGKIHTMDAQDRVVSQVTIQDGRVAFVGPVGNHKLSPCTKVINLHGRTVVPGLIDDHNHFILFSLRPGHEIQLETATSIRQALALLKHRAATVSPGAWVTTVGDWLPRQFAENREPTLAELDRAVPKNPVLLMPAFGPTVTNSLGRKFFESKGIAVSPAGVIAPGNPTWAALAALRSMWNLEDEIGGTEYAQRYMLRYGLTTSVDMGFFALPGSPDLQDSAAMASIASLDPWTAYDAVLALDHEHKLDERVRLFTITQDKDMSLPILTERLLNVFPNFGDGMLRVSGIGEFATPWFFGFGGRPVHEPANYEAALKLVAQYGWSFQQHTLSLSEVQFTAHTYEEVNAVTPIAKLHWSIAHVPVIDPQTLAAMKAINVGMALHGWHYLGGVRPGSQLPAGPPYRTILDSGVHVGAGSDAGDIAVLDPWLNIYYMVTGKDCTGQLINAGETVTRQQALKMYTADNGWFFREGNQLGSISQGKLADLAVLSADYFNPKKVSDEGIKDLKSVLTVVGGRVVYNDLH
jgi:predicted amidohydrolase YtcJ